jgi:aspartyl-tRNA(Asn)/glutamyl-tRNA(Gln) amidotransferase subunit C
VVAVDVTQVEKTADLAKLRFTPGELEKFTVTFQEILTYFAQLQAVSTEGVEPMYHALLQESPQTPMREDEVKPSLGPDASLANAPRAAEQQFVVPRVVE